MAKVDCIYDGRLNEVGLGEGPHWDHKNQRLLWLDVFDSWDQTKGKALHMYDTASGSAKAVELSEPVTSVIPRKNSSTSVVLTFKRNFGYFDLETRKFDIIKTVDDEKPNNRFNDGKCDALGRYWSGTMGPEPVPLQIVREQGSMYCLERGGSNTLETRCHYDKISISNGIAWSRDNKKMYHVDSIIRTIFGFDFDLETGSLTNKRDAIVVDVALGFPDGICMDTEDKLWIAIYGGGQVARYDPVTGALLCSVKIPAKYTTSCCWGGKNLDELYVTSMGYSGKNPEDDPLGGSLFKVTNLGCRGMPANEFDG